MKLRTLKPKVRMLSSQRGARAALPSESLERRNVYDSRRWREKVRPQKLRRDPLCQRCKVVGLAVPALHVDHEVSIAIGGDPWADSNLISLCHSCHSIATACEQQGKPKPPVAPSTPRAPVVV